MRVPSRWPRALALAAALNTAALVPLLSDQLPRSADGRPHLLRMVALYNAWTHGEIWPRFLPDLIYGYGYPLFNYYAPLIYYLGAGLHALGLSFVAALQMILALALVGGAWGVWRLTEAWFHSAAGAAVAAGLYLFAPYTLFNILARGAAPEALATALLPWLLWSLHRALRHPSAGALTRLALGVAALFLTHNLLSLLGVAGLVVGFGLEGVAARPERIAGADYGRAGLAILAGLALAAFFWVPAFLETGAVQVAQLTAPATLDFRHYFLTVSQLLTPSFTVDLRLEPPSFPVAFGLPQALAALAAGLAWRRYSAAARGRVAILLVLLGGALFLTLEVSRPVWELIGPLRVLQFPWRFLGLATVLAALLAGAAVSACMPVLSPPRGMALALGIIVGAGLCALPWSFITRYPARQVPPNPTLTNLFDYEVESGGFGLTSTGEFLPVGVTQLPAPESLRTREGEPAHGDIRSVDRLSSADLPASVAVVSQSSQRLAAEARLRSAAAFDATFLWFYFPGWEAAVDGQPALAHAAGPHGFLTVPMPAGEHTVRVAFGTTPLRQAAGALSAVGVVGLLGLIVAMRRRPPAEGAQVTAHPDLSRSAWLAVLGVGLALGGLRVWAASCENIWCRSRFDGQTIAGAGQTLDVNFGDRLRLIGTDPPAPTPADQPLRFTLYWRLAAPVAEDYSLAVQVWDADGHLVGQQDAWQPGGQPTHRWLAGGYAADVHALTVYPGTPPGQYRLMLGVYPVGGGNVNVLDADGQPQGAFYEAGPITLQTPTRPPSEAEFAPVQRLNARLGPLTLVGLDGLTSGAQAGDALSLVWYWRAAQAPRADWRARLELVGPNGEAALLTTVSPAGEQFPTSMWSAGAGVRAPVSLLLPAAALPGRSTLRLTLVDAAGQAVSAPVALGDLEVRVPARVFTAPAFPAPLNLRFGAALLALGESLTPATPHPGRALTLTLYWRALQTMTVRYTVFVHLIDAQGRLAAQVDMPPVQGARPTTGWLPPEVITDEYTIKLPADLSPGPYQLEIGVYDPQSGARLPVSDAAGQALGDHAVVKTVAINP